MNTHDQEFDLHGEEGSVTLISLVAAFTLMLILALLVNSGYVVTRKIETQNAADAAASAASVEMARGMNAVTATNHLIGELSALVVLHHSFGGFELDLVWAPEGVQEKVVEVKEKVNEKVDAVKEKVKEKLRALRAKLPAKVRAIVPPFKASTDVQNDLKEAYDSAKDANQDVKPDPATYEQVHDQPLTAGGAIGDSRITLKKVLTQIYQVHAMGGVLSTIGDIIAPVKPLGVALIILAVAMEMKVDMEWVILDALEIFMGAPAKLAVWQIGVPVLYEYSAEMVDQAPAGAEAAAQAVGREHNMQITLYPSANESGGPALRLPVHTEPAFTSTMKSQLVRATVPWVRWWRIPVLGFGRALLSFSEFESHYQERCDENVLIVCFTLKLINNVNLYVMDDLVVTLSDKGHERWTTDSQRADELFSVVAFAQRPPTPVMGGPLFRQPNPDGLVAYSQAMIYNGNPQEPPLLFWQVPFQVGVDLEFMISGQAFGDDVMQQFWEEFKSGNGLPIQPLQDISSLYYQPKVGWDTLNWVSSVPEQNMLIDPIGGYLDTVLLILTTEPTIKPNWQAKLVPTTRLKEAVQYTKGGPVGAVLGRLPADPRPLDSTH